MERYYFIVNPIAGSGRAKKAFDAVRAMLDERGVDYGFKLTEYGSHAVALAKAALDDGEKRIIGVGGDGTAQELASVIIGSDAAMGLLPFGTGNDFARALGLSSDPKTAALDLLGGVIRKIDAATANDRIFINVAGTGFDVDVVKYTERFKRRFNGMLPYMLGIFQSLLHLRPMRLRLTYDGITRETSAILVNACNGTHFAGGINVAPEAKPDDGLLDVCIVGDVGLMGFLWLLPRYMKGRHLASPHVEYFKTALLTVETPDASTLNLDGELGCSLPARFSCLPGALNVIVPDTEVTG